MKNKLKPKILFEDADILVLDKPANLPVTTAKTIQSETLQDFLSGYFNLGTSLGIGLRAGIVHRLDKDTSGVIIVAKTQKSFESLQKQFKSRQVEKTYYALVHQIPKFEKFTIEAKIGRTKFGKFGVKILGKMATTNFAILQKFEFSQKPFEKILKNFSKNQQRYFKKQARNFTFLEIKPSTGRTHQIRVHLKSAQNPVVSDPLYLPAKLAKFDQFFCPRLFLHAVKIKFLHPTKLQPITFEAKLPNDLNSALLYLKEIR